MLDLVFSSQLCQWILDFLSDGPQTVRLVPHTFTTLTLSTGAVQSCVLRMLLCALYTQDCLHLQPENMIIKFADDTTVMVLNSNRNEVGYRHEVHSLRGAPIIDLKWQRGSALLKIGSEERVPCFKFLGVTISEDFKWIVNFPAIIKKKRGTKHFLITLRKVHLESFYHRSIEGILTYCITVWFRNSLAASRAALQMVIKAAQGITGHVLPPLKEIHQFRWSNRACDIVKDITQSQSVHPAPL